MGHAWACATGGVLPICDAGNHRLGVPERSQNGFGTKLHTSGRLGGDVRGTGVARRLAAAAAGFSEAIGLLN
jgi:hypothetical protein